MYSIRTVYLPTVATCGWFSNKITSAMSNKEAVFEVGEVQRVIQSKLEDKLKPSHLKVINESYMHSVPKGSESHFKVVVVSDKFDGLAPLKRHRLIMDTLKEQLEGCVHALSIQAITPTQWETSGGSVLQSPPCLGGSKT